MIRKRKRKENKISGGRNACKEVTAMPGFNGKGSEGREGKEKDRV